MSDKMQLTDDELQADTRANLLEIERRLKSAGLNRSYERVLVAHRILSDVESRVHAAGYVAQRSPADDKEDDGEEPTN